MCTKNPASRHNHVYGIYVKVSDSRFYLQCVCGDKIYYENDTKKVYLK